MVACSQFVRAQGGCALIAEKSAGLIQEMNSPQHITCATFPHTHAHISTRLHGATAPRLTNDQIIQFITKRSIYSQCVDVRFLRAFIPLYCVSICVCVLFCAFQNAHPLPQLAPRKTAHTVDRQPAGRAGAGVGRSGAGIYCGIPFVVCCARCWIQLQRTRYIPKTNT